MHGNMCVLTKGEADNGLKADNTEKNIQWI